MHIHPLLFSGLLAWFSIDRVLAASPTPAPSPAAEAGPRGLTPRYLEPLPAEERSLGSAGVFVGVNEFSEDEGLQALKFAVNDAVAQAHLFVVDLGLIPAANCRLLLAGTPSGTAVGLLAELKQRGVRIDPAGKSKILVSLREAANRESGVRDLLVVSLSTHGFEREGVAYVLPADGLVASLTDMGVSLATVQDLVGRSAAGKKLLLVDACREKVTSGAKGTGAPMSEAFTQAFAAAKGMAVLHACSPGQVSLEKENLGHGVFTHHLLQALREGAVAPGPDGLVRLGGVMRYLKQEVPKWVARNSAGLTEDQAQQPSITDQGGQAEEIPLAVSGTHLEQVKQREARLTAAEAKLAALRKAQRKILTPEVQVGMQTALDEWAEVKVEPLLRRLEKTSPSEADAVEDLVAWWKVNVTPAAVRLAPARPDSPYTNSLGMKFVPVPITGGPTDGKPVLFSVWETRVRDYQAYAEANAGVDVSWKDPGFAQTADHPVVMVSWEDATAFAAWLTRTERSQGLIGPGDTYRLPSDHEWSCAVGIGDREDASATPEAKTRIVSSLYPWGNSYPPPAQTGNYDSSLGVDRYESTSPVGSFAANRLGLFDLGGNVWEWCLDEFGPMAPSWRVLRGASWNYHNEHLLLSSVRRASSPVPRNNFYGFRLVSVRRST